MEWYWQGKPEVLGEKPVPLPICQPNMTRGPVARGQQVATWTKAQRPSCKVPVYNLCTDKQLMSTHHLHWQVKMVVPTDQLNNSMQHNYSQEANSCSPSQEVHCILWNSKIHYNVHNSPTLLHNRSQINQIHYFPFYFFKIHFNTILPPMSRSSEWSLPAAFQSKSLHKLPFSSPHTCHILILLHFITWTLSGKEYKSRSSSLCNSLQSPVISSLLAQISSSEPYWNAHGPLIWKIIFHTHTKPQVQL